MALFGKNQEKTEQEKRQQEQWEAYRLRKKQEEEAQRERELKDPTSKAYKEAQKAAEAAERAAKRASEKEQRENLKADIENEKLKAKLQASGLDLDSYTDDDIRQRVMQEIASVNSSLVGSGLYQFGSLLSGHGDTGMIMSLLQAIINQNWILVRQNEQLLRELKKMNGE